MFRQVCVFTVVFGIVLGLAADAVAQRDVPVSGEAGPGLDHFDVLMLSLLKKHQAPGGSLSIAHHGRLVLARGYGWAVVEPRVPVAPRCFLARRVFPRRSPRRPCSDWSISRSSSLTTGPSKSSATSPPCPARRWTRGPTRSRSASFCTTRADTGPSPTVAEVAGRFGVGEPKLTAEQMMRFWIGRPLDFDPGTEARYSNYGYLVLGAVVARVTGEPYDHHVQNQVFGPMGIHRSALGTWGVDYPPGQVHRYGPKGKELPPNRPLPGAAGGGWILSTVDMVRFLTALDGSRGERFLSDAMTRAMLAPPPAPIKPRPNGTHFGLGWDIVQEMPRGVIYSKNGGLPGVRAVIGHMPGDVDWAVAFNGGNNVEDAPGEDADAQDQIQTAIRQTKAWPRVDLFSRYP